MSLGPHHPYHHPLNRNQDTRGHPNSQPGHHDRLTGELSSIKEGGTAQPEQLAPGSADYESDEENSALLEPKPVDNYTGKYTKEEILALHRTDYPPPQGFIFEEDITSKIQLLPVALSRFTRSRNLDSSSLRGSFATQEGSSNFFLGRPIKAARGRGRRFNEDHVGLNFSPPLDPRTQFLQSESIGISHHMSNPNININNINQSGIIPNHNLASSLHSSTHQLNISMGPTTSNPTSLAGSTHQSQYTPAGGSSYGFNSFSGEDFILDDEKWYYKDPKGQERGPFGSMQMDKWVKFDFFKVDLMVRRENSEYVYLGDIFFSEGKNPFTGEPLDQWFMGPTSEFKISLMLLIQNYHMNRMKQEQPIPSQVEYEFNLNKNVGEQQQQPPPNNPSAYVTEPPLPFNKAASSQSLSKSTTMTLPLKSEIEEGSTAVPEKRVAESTKPSSEGPWNEYPPAEKTMWWANTSDPSLGSSGGAWYGNSSNPTSSQKPAAPAPVPPGTKDFYTLQKEQTQQLQQIVAQMNKPRKAKKKKGKKEKTNQPAAKPAINISQPIHKKPQNESQDQPPKSSNLPASQKPSTNVPQNNNTSAQKPQPADNKTKPQSPPQTRQSLNKKPKPQYKVKETTPSEPDLKPNDQDSNNANAAAASPTQFSKRQNIRQPKVWKRKDEDLNDDENN